MENEDFDESELVFLFGHPKCFILYEFNYTVTYSVYQNVCFHMDIISRFKRFPWKLCIFNSVDKSKKVIFHNLNSLLYFLKTTFMWYFLMINSKVFTVEPVHDSHFKLLIVTVFYNWLDLISPLWKIENQQVSQVFRFIIYSTVPNRHDAKITRSKCRSFSCGMVSINFPWIIFKPKFHWITISSPKIYRRICCNSIW